MVEGQTIILQLLLVGLVVVEQVAALLVVMLVRQEQLVKVTLVEVEAQVHQIMVQAVAVGLVL